MRLSLTATLSHSTYTAIGVGFLINALGQGAMGDGFIAGKPSPTIPFLLRDSVATK